MGGRAHADDPTCTTRAAATGARARASARCGGARVREMLAPVGPSQGYKSPTCARGDRIAADHVCSAQMVTFSASELSSCAREWYEQHNARVIIPDASVAS